MRAGRAAERPALLEAGVACLDALLARIDEAPEELWGDFHVLTPAAHAVGEARRLGNWSREREAPFQRAALEAAGNYVKGRRMTHGNRDVSRVAGIATAAALYPEDPRWDPARDRVDAFLDHHLALGDLDENAPAYASLGLLRFLEALRARGREREWIDPRWREVFERYRACVSPAGRMPEWGDDYFKIDPPFHWMFLFEYAARAWQAPRFAVTARRMLRARRPDVQFDEADLARSTGLFDLRPWTRPATDGPSGDAMASPSRITERITAKGARTLDKLILRPSAEPTSPMVLVDLYCRGDHTHLDKLGAVTFYESDGVPHFTNYGRYRQSAAHANLVLAVPEGEAFPPGNWQPGQWIEQSLPVERLPADPADPERRALQTLWFRNHPKQEEHRLRLADLRLTGPGGELSLDRFETLGWRPAADCVEAEGPGSGPTEHAIEFLLHETVYNGPEYARTFDPREYSHLRYAVRYDGPSIPKVQTRFHGGYDSWHFVGQTTLLAKTEDARVEPWDDGARATIRLAPYLTLDSALTRQIVLLGDGTLVLRDDLDAGDSLTNHVAGPLWQLYNTAERGADWFYARPNLAYRTAAGEGPGRVERALVVKFATRPGTGARYGVRTIPEGKGGATIGGDTDLHSAYAAAPVRAAGRSTFVTVVRPCAPGVPAREVAETIEVTFDDQDALARIGSRTVRLPGR